ncbi:MAG: ATP-binding protein [Verrucomicrobia bacterium]|nr:ATP-binding protein [Verrucomicrobiota bacterium]
MRRQVLRFFKPADHQSYFLFGPRGTGKTTWLKTNYPSALWINLLEPLEFRLYVTKPEALRELIDGYPEKKTIVIDEIQRVPALLPLIHSLIEEKRGLQFILTGSSARKIKREGGDLLAGRAAMCYMQPFFAAELGELFSLDQALSIGLLPLVWNAENPVVTLKGYAGLYLKEEIQEEGLVRNLGDFARFLETISFSHGSLLNVSNIAKECGITRATVESYIHILQDFLLAYLLPVFTKRAKRQLVSHPKFYYFDAGVFRYLRPQGPLDRASEIDGAALEGLVGQHLHAWCQSQIEPHTFAFWQTRSRQEVDFVVYGPKTFVGIEVKNAAQLSHNDFSGLKAFQEEYPEAKTLLVYRGTRRAVINGVFCMPCGEFLLRLHPNMPINVEP